MDLVYSLDRKEIERRFIENGQTLPIEQRIPFPVDELTPDLRAHITRTVGPKVPEAFFLSVYRPDMDGNGVVTYPGDRITLPAIPDMAEAVDLLLADAARWDTAEIARQQRKAERESARQQAEAANRRRADEQQRQSLADAEAKAARKADKAAWVAAHGSDHLRAAHAAGYDCQRKYVTERAAMERPDYAVDFSDNAAWRDRSCPSAAALAEALSVGGEVVWLTTDENNEPVDRSGGESDGAEAVVIRQYLGKYDLIKQF